MLKPSLIPAGFVAIESHGEVGTVILSVRQIDSVLLVPRGIPILDITGNPTPIDVRAVVVGTMGGSPLSIPADNEPSQLLKDIDEAQKWWRFLREDYSGKSGIIQPTTTTPQ